MRKTAIIALCFPLALAAQKDTLRINRAAYGEPTQVFLPFKTDSVNAENKKFDEQEILTKNANSPLIYSKDAKSITTGTALKNGSRCLHRFAFTLTAEEFTKGELNMPKMKNVKVFLDGEAVNKNKLTLEPIRHNVLISCMTDENSTDTFDIRFICDKKGAVRVNDDTKRPYTLYDVTEGTKYSGIELSPSGKYLLTTYTVTDKQGNSSAYSKLTETASGKLLYRSDNASPLRWMPSSDRLYYTKQIEGSLSLVTMNPATLEETIKASNIPQGWFRISPTEDRLIYTVTDNAPKNQGSFRQIFQPDDRMGGWRNRSSLYCYSLKTGIFQQLTFGSLSAHLNDISPNGKEILFSTNKTDLSCEPFSTLSLFRMNLENMKVDTLMLNEGYVSDFRFSPDGKELLVKGSPNAFGNIGLRIKEDQKANIFDEQLFLYSPSTKKAITLTADFNPNVERFTWSRADGQIYFLAGNRDRVDLYSCNPKTRKIKRYETYLDCIQNISFASLSPHTVYYGQTSTTSRTLYAMSLTVGKPQLSGDLRFSQMFADTEISPCKPWSFKTSHGDTITGRYYLPRAFDATKKYPLIVYYYGGTTPTASVLEVNYPYEAWAAQGYAVLVLQPSGTTGFGQEFSARHVNAWGKRTADEIIEGTRCFFREHSFADSTKIGCLGASYGGFMTEHLVTKTNLFATAISHAGISNVASYWGGGYWGYSYNEIAARGSYPWNNPKLYVEQSPLFSADKINTPLLLLHGDSDTNVPTNESQQLFTALKILGKEVAYVNINGENHVVANYEKQKQWQRTILAWFAKYLKGQGEWWNEYYPKKNY